MINDAAQYLEISFTGKLSIVDHIMSRSHMLLFAPHSRSRIRLFAVPCTGDTIGLEETTNPGREGQLEWRNYAVVSSKTGHGDPAYSDSIRRLASVLSRSSYANILHCLVYYSGFSIVMKSPVVRTRRHHS